MKAVIMAAGEGKRMGELTKDKPKPLVLLNGKPLLEHIIDDLPKEIEEIILVIGYKKEQIVEYFGDHYKARKITYVVQEKAEGTWRALKLAEDKFGAEDQKFLVINADDLQSKESIGELTKFDCSILTAKSDNPSKFGVVQSTAEGYLERIDEKPEHPIGDQVSTGVYVLPTSIFHMEDPKPRGEKQEFYLADVVDNFLKENQVKMKVVPSKFWSPVGDEKELKRAEQYLNELKNKREGIIRIITNKFLR